jgi:hypothetical protein
MIDNFILNLHNKGIILGENIITASFNDIYSAISRARSPQEPIF